MDSGIGTAPEPGGLPGRAADSWSGASAANRVGAVLRRYPFTLGYLAILGVTAVLTMVVLARPDADDLLRGLSTNLANLAHRPLVAIIGSGLVVDIDSDLFAVLFFVVFGLMIALPTLERRCGSLRTLGVFATGHVGGTALVAAVELYGLHHGMLPDTVRTDFDYGVSYGVMAVLGAMAMALPVWPRLPAAIFLVGWPLLGTEWTPLPDLTSLGHASAAVLGLLCGALLFAGRRRLGRRAADPVVAQVSAGPR